MTTKLNSLQLSSAVLKFSENCARLTSMLQADVSKPDQLELLDTLSELETSSTSLTKKVVQGMDTRAVGYIPFSWTYKITKLETEIAVLKCKLEHEKNTVKYQADSKHDTTQNTGDELEPVRDKKRARSQENDDDDGVTDTEENDDEACNKKSTKSTTNDNVYNALACIHHHIGNSKTIGDLTNAQMERVITKMSDIYMKMISKALTSLYFRTRDHQPGDKVVTQAAKTRFESIPFRFAFSPEEKRRIYLTMKACFFDVIPSTLTSDFKLNATRLITTTFKYFFGLYHNNEIFEGITAAWNEKRLDVAYLKTLGNNGGGNMFFFAEDPVGFVSSILQSFGDGKNHFIGDNSTENTHGYFTYNYKTTAINTDLGKRKRDEKLKGFLNESATVYYHDGNKTYTRYSNKKSLLDTEDSFPFADFNPRAYRRVSKYAIELLGKRGLTAFLKKFPEVFSQSNFTHIIKELKLNEIDPIPHFFQSGEIHKHTKRDVAKEKDADEEEVVAMTPI